jgi:hypothetical protein
MITAELDNATMCIMNSTIGPGALAWQVRAAGPPGARSVNSIAFSPDGQMLAADVGSGPATYLWKIR